MCVFDADDEDGEKTQRVNNRSASTDDVPRNSYKLPAIPAAQRYRKSSNNRKTSLNTNFTHRSAGQYVDADQNQNPDDASRERRQGTISRPLSRKLSRSTSRKTSRTERVGDWRGSRVLTEGKERLCRVVDQDVIGADKVITTYFGKLPGE